MKKLQTQLSWKTVCDVTDMICLRMDEKYFHRHDRKNKFKELKKEQTIDK